MIYRDTQGAHRDAGIPVTGRSWSDQRVSGDDLAGVIFQDCVFDGVVFSGVNLLQTLFLNCQFQDCRFAACTLVQTRWVECQGSNIAIADGELAEVLLAGTRLDRLVIEQAGRQVVLADSQIGHLQFDSAGCAQDGPAISSCTFKQLSAENAVWTGASAVALDFSCCSFAGARFERCNFVRSAAREVDFSPIVLEACNLYQSDLAAARFRHAERTIFAECQLAGADFREAALAGALFAKVQAPEARFDGARLQGAMFPNAVLSGASLVGALAQQSVWTDALLQDADLAGMDATQAVLRNAVLAGARVEGARFVAADLHGVKEALSGADLRDARNTVQWRAELEDEARKEPS